MVVTSLETGDRFYFENFISYKFDSSIVVPVDTFSFQAATPDSPVAFTSVIKSGDIVSIFGNDVPICTGVIDEIDVEIDADSGEMVTISGRDMMAPLEDNEAVNQDNQPVYNGQATVTQVLRLLTADTRCPQEFILRNISDFGGLLFATDPGETRLSSLQRFLKPINCLAWTSPQGKIIVGKPSMKAAESLGEFRISKTNRDSNVMNMKVSERYARTMNQIAVLWPAQDQYAFTANQGQRFVNRFPGPARLSKLGHKMIKSTTVQNPQGADAGSFNEVNAIKQNKNRLAWYAESEIAMANFEAFQVQVTVPYHYNSEGRPLVPDQVYHIFCDRAGVDKKMYLYQVSYELSDERGRISNLFFCDLGTIVAGVAT